MNAMQELAIKYPTLWEHIAKGGKVRGVVRGAQKKGPWCNLLTLSSYTRIQFGLDDSTFYEDIELLPLPKRVPTRDLGKAVNWFDNYSEQHMHRDEHAELFYVYECKKVYFETIREIVFLRRNIPDWWPEELMEDESES